MAERPYTTDYSNRTVDVEVLRTITEPGGVRRMHLSLAQPPSKIVTGMQKLAQRYTIILLTRMGDVKFDVDEGTDFWDSMLRGAAQNSGQVSIAFAFANSDATAQLRLEDENIDLYGEIPEDERLDNAELIDYYVDYNTATLYLEVLLTNLVGDEYVYVIPATVARR